MRLFVWWVLLSCCITMLIAAANTDTLAFLCLSGNLAGAAVIGWKIHTATEYPEGRG